MDVNLFLGAAGIRCRHVPFKGGADAISAVLGRHADFTGVSIAHLSPLAEGKKIRVLAVTGKRRAKFLPDVPTFQELGIQNADFLVWSGFFVPKKTPEDIVKKLREVAEKVAKDSQFINAVEKTGDEVVFMNGDEFAKFWETESEMIARLFERMTKEKGPSK